MIRSSDERRFDGPEFIDLGTAAERMNLTKDRVMDLVRIGALRYQMVGNEPWVQPAILTGAVPE